MQGDWGACALIAQRMALPASYSSDIQRGKKRPGIGGAPKGRAPWNKGITGYKLKCDRRGKRFNPTKLTIEDVKHIRRLHQTKFAYTEYELTLERRKQQRGTSGKKLPYERFLSKYLQSTSYQALTAAAIYAAITRKTWKDV
jgi:hypothetical protein